MKIEPIQTIIEGCYPDTPRKLMYAERKEQLPQNAQLFVYERTVPQKYLLYAKTDDFMHLTIENNPSFSKKQNPSEKLKGGMLLNEKIENFSWIFDAQRSLITRDGRIYVQATYFWEEWRWYLDAVPTILEECEQIFRQERTADNFNEHPSRAG